MEVLLSGNDVDGELAERYGYVNRALPDAQLDQFVETMARRIAKFDKQTIIDIKRLVNVSSLPSDEEIGSGWDAFITSVGRPQAQQDVRQLMLLGLQKKPDVEEHLADYTGKLDEPPR